MPSCGCWHTICGIWKTPWSESGSAPISNAVRASSCCRISSIGHAPRGDRPSAPAVVYELQMTTSSGSNGILIVGGGLAATRTAEQLRRANFAGPVTIVSDEVHLPYDRPPLSKEVLRSEVDDVTLKPREFYDEQNITLRLGAAATGIDAAAHSGVPRLGRHPGAAFVRRKPGLAPARIQSTARGRGRRRIHRL